MYVFLGVAWIQLAGNKCVSSFRCVLIQNRAKTVLPVAKSNETTHLKNDGWNQIKMMVGISLEGLGSKLKKHSE